VKLPLLVEYGATAWKVAACLVAVLGLVATRMVRNARERRRARADVARLLADVSAPVLATASGPTSITGTLRGGTASTLWVGKRSASDRAGELWLESRGQRIELAGNICVVRGTVGHVSRTMPKNTPSAIRAAFALGLDHLSRVTRVMRRARGGEPHRLSEVRNGDLVIVRGMLGRPGGVDRLGVRTWLLDPETPGGEIAVVAMSPRAVAMPLRWYVAVLVAGILAGGASAGMYAFARHTLDRSRGTPLAADAQLGNWDALSLAAAAPGTRDAALEEIARRYPALRAQLEDLR
jgi:hypothetical protein